jgi:hypothetical protein
MKRAVYLDARKIRQEREWTGEGRRQKDIDAEECE